MTKLLLRFSCVRLRNGQASVDTTLPISSTIADYTRMYKYRRQKPCGCNINALISNLIAAKEKISPITKNIRDVSSFISCLATRTS